MGYNANSGSAATTTNGDDNVFKVWLAFQPLQCFCGYASNQQGFIGGMDITIAVRVRQFFAVQLGFVVGLTVLDDLGAHPFHRRDFAGIGIFGDDDDGFDTEEARGIGDGLPMIAGGSRDDAALALLSTELS